MSTHKKTKPRKDSWSDERIRFVRDNCAEMSLAEMANELNETVERVRSLCTKRFFSYFTETRQSLKSKGYIAGSNGYAMYPYKGSYRESASIQNSMLGELL